MPIIVTELYDALKKAGVDDEMSRKAAESVAASETRLTRLTTLIQAAIGILIVIAGSQAGLWFQMGQTTAQLAQISTQIARLQPR